MFSYFKKLYDEYKHKSQKLDAQKQSLSYRISDLYALHHDIKQIHYTEYINNARDINEDSHGFEEELILESLFKQHWGDNESHIRENINIYKNNNFIAVTSKSTLKKELTAVEDKLISNVELTQLTDILNKK